MFYTHVAAALVSAAVAAAGAWQVQSWRYGNQIAQIKQAHADAVASAIEATRKDEQNIAKRYQGALNDARKRQTRLQADADSARSELDRLRDATGAAIATAQSGDTCTASPGLEVARTDVLGACQATIGELAKELVDIARSADAHASDVRTLIEAWPTPGQ